MSTVDSPLGLRRPCHSELSRDLSPSPPLPWARCGSGNQPHRTRFSQWSHGLTPRPGTEGFIRNDTGVGTRSRLTFNTALHTTTAQVLRRPAVTGRPLMLPLFVPLPEPSRDRISDSARTGHHQMPHVECGALGPPVASQGSISQWHRSTPANHQGWVQS